MQEAVQIEVPVILLERAHASVLGEAQKLIIALLEGYARGLEKAQVYQAYESYYANRTSVEEAEE